MKKIIEEQLNCICEPTEIIDNESEYRFRRNIAGNWRTRQTLWSRPCRC